MEIKLRNFLFVLLIVFLISNVSASVFVDEDTSYVSVNVHEGWNLIAGMSFADEDLHEDSGLDYSSILSAYYYDAETGEDVQIRPVYEAGDIEPLILYSKAFWVLSLSDGNIKYKASPSFLDKNRVGGYYQFYEGDNFIAINDDMYGLSIGQLAGDCEIIDVKYWDANVQDWVEVNSNLDFETRDELVGKGIGLTVSNDCGFGNVPVNSVANVNQNEESSNFSGQRRGYRPSNPADGENVLENVGVLEEIRDVLVEEGIVSESTPKPRVLLGILIALIVIVIVVVFIIIYLFIKIRGVAKEKDTPTVQWK